MNNLIIDCNNICHIVYHAIPKDLSTNDKSTSVIYGFLSKLLAIKKLHRDKRVLFTWDSRKSYRRKIYPEYKANRKDQDLTKEEKKEKEIMFKQFEDLRTIVLNQMGFRNIYRRTGFEADDLIAKLVLDSDDKVNVIVSTDEDLYQLLSKLVMRNGHYRESPLTYIFNPRKKLDYYHKNFVEDYGIDPQQWSLVKAIAGCKSDNILGVEGAGEKKAISFITGDLRKGKIFDRIQDADEMIESNLLLTDLPFSSGYALEDLPVKPDELDIKNFIHVFNGYGFESFLKRIDTWREAFNL